MTIYEEHQAPVWKAGEIAPPGIYMRIDDDSYRKITLTREEPLPATFDGHVALYCIASNTAMLHATTPQTR